MENIIILFVENIIVSSSIFFYLIYKAKIRKKYIYTDNILIITILTFIGSIIFNLLSINNIILLIIINPVLTFFLIILLTLFHFYRDPERYNNANVNDILSPADGFVVYIKRVERKETPFSVKGKTISKLKELTKVNILNNPYWLMGIVMTLFDVHVVRAPTFGNIVFNKYFKGKFISLKDGESDIENERNTTVIENDFGQIGIIQIASKSVRGIESYVKVKHYVKMGQRIGKIKFGSQVDLIIPKKYKINIKLKDQVFGGKTIVASLEDN